MVDRMQHYDPYGTPFGSQGTLEAPFGFTGEMTDANGLLYLRARYYNPALGVFNSRDPFEGAMGRPMSLNGYSWVEGNSINRVDPSGLQAEATICFVCPNCCIAGLVIVGGAALIWLLLQNGVDIGDLDLDLDQSDANADIGPCETNFDPGTYMPFKDTKDLLCNLRRYSPYPNPYGIATYEALGATNHQVQIQYLATVH